VPIDEVVVGDLLRVRPGDRIPADGVVEDGSSAVDEAMLTGESLPVGKAPGDAVIAGCINGNGSFTLRATAVGADTVLAGIVRLVDHAQGSKLPVQKLADRISARFVPAVGGIAGTDLRRLAAGRQSGGAGAGARHRRAAHRLPLRARAGDADRDHGRHRPGGAARHLHPQRRGAGNREPS
jgi:hypothetical protein